MRIFARNFGTNYRSKRIFAGNFGTNCRSKRIFARNFGTNYRSKRIFARKFASTTTIGIAKIRRIFCELSRWTKIRHFSSKSPEIRAFRRITFSLLFHNTVSDCFFSKFVNLNIVTTKKLLGKSKQANNPFLANHKTTKSTSQIERFCVSRMKVLSVGSTMLLSFQLHQLGLRPQDVGGAGDCFFRAISHQLYGDPSYHRYIRQAGIHYLRENPERFIESNTHNSWNEYLRNVTARFMV